jgi:deoxyribodipyrimidine photo-lyase
MTPIEQQSDGCVIGADYPARIVDHHAAYHHARDRIYALRETDAVQEAKEAILEKHGSRKRR